MNRKDGSALTLSVLFSAIITVMATGMFVMTSRDSAESTRLRDSMQAFFLAEAGANEMASILRTNFADKDDPSSFPSGTLGAGSYAVTVTQPGGRVVIDSTGTVNGVSRRVLIEVASETGSEAFGFDVFANGNITLSGNANITGGAGANGNATMSGNAIIAGDATVQGTVSTSGNANVTGDENEGASPVTFPTIDFNQYYNLAVSGGLYYSTNQSWSGNSTVTSPNGIIYVNGSVNISGNVVVNGAIIATGSVSMSGNAVQNQSGSYPALMSRDSNITLSGNAISDGLIYAALGNVTMSGNAQNDGKIIAFGNVTMSGNADMDDDGDDSLPVGVAGSGEGFRWLTYHE